MAEQAKRVTNPRIRVRGESLHMVAVINRALHVDPRLDDASYQHVRRWFGSLCDAHVEGFPIQPASPTGEQPNG